jgi:hypothetical protein
MEELGPRIQIKYTFDGTNPEPFEEFSEDLLSTSKLILKLAYHFLGDLHFFLAFPLRTGRQSGRKFR